MASPPNTHPPPSLPAQIAVGEILTAFGAPQPSRRRVAAWLAGRFTVTTAADISPQLRAILQARARGGGEGREGAGISRRSCELSLPCCLPLSPLPLPPPLLRPPPPALLLPLLPQALLGRLVEPEEHALAEGLAALAAVTGAVPLEELALHLDFVRSCLAALLSDAQVRGREGRGKGGEG